MAPIGKWEVRGWERWYVSCFQHALSICFKRLIFGCFRCIPNPTGLVARVVVLKAIYGLTAGFRVSRPVSPPFFLPGPEFPNL